jgi:hypothetical protein
VAAYATTTVPAAHPPVPTPLPTATPPPAPRDPDAACRMLASDPRCADFARALMVRPPGRWSQVSEVCRTAGIALPASLADELELHAAWLDHPHADPSLATVVFVALRTGWSTVVLCRRAR